MSFAIDGTATFRLPAGALAPAAHMHLRAPCCTVCQAWGSTPGYNDVLAALITNDTTWGALVAAMNSASADA